ncbi:hypothetical protein ONE63_003738 [Megalurothrips usitatus]|uniref:RRM domain-containing protein n=1 Tax=Megalurothrips usitatus TaxID=439358 RepID=A0AAV7X3Y2_9NEOP|nr:hypothetical protein ONE63_003738 [Megalurothrips usitatus]
MDDSGPKSRGMASNGSARSPGRGGSRGRGGDRGGRGRGGMRGRGNFRGGDRSASRGRGKFLGNNRGSFQGSENGSVRGSFRGRGSVRGRGNFRGGDRSPFRGRGRGRGNFRGGDRGGKGRGGLVQRKRKSSDSEQEGSDDEQENSDAEQEGSDSNDNTEVNKKSTTGSKGSVEKPKKPKQSQKKKKIIGDKKWGGEVPGKTLLPGQPGKAVKISNLPSPFTDLDKDLKKLAETVGPVELLTYNKFNHPKGCIMTGICVYKDKEHVPIAVEKLHGHEFHGNHLLVQILTPPNDIRLNDQSVCVSNLSEETSEEDLWKFFGDCGSISMIEMRRENNKLTPEASCLARIYFDDSDGVDGAVALSNTTFQGSKIKVFALNYHWVVYVKNFEMQTQYKTIKEFMAAVNAVYYCYVKVKHPTKMKGLLYFLKDEESYNKIASHENFSTFPLKEDKVIGCLNLSLKKKVPNSAGQILKTVQSASVVEENSDTNDSEGADQDDVAQVTQEKSKKKKIKKKKVAEVLSEEPTAAKKKKASAPQKRKGNEANDSSPSKKKKKN